MALTAARRRLKRINTAVRNNTMSLAMLMAGLLLIMNGQLAVANPLILAGLRVYRSSKEELTHLESPYSFRDIYPIFRRCSLESFAEDEYHDMLRFDKPLCRSFVNYLLRYKNFDEFIRVPYVANYRMQYHVFHIEELFLMTLFYAARPRRQLEVAVRFGRTVPEVCIGVSFFHECLFPISKDFLQNDQQVWFDQETVELCAEVIARKGCPMQDCCGYVDGNFQEQKVLASPVHQWYLNCAFLNNILNTQYPNAISQYFGMAPPALETYLDVPMGSLQ